MKTTLRLCFILSGAMALVSACAQERTQSPLPPFKPVASVKEIMESLVSRMAEDVWSAVGTIIDERGVQDIVPKDAQAWEDVRFAAMGLAETGNLLMFETRAKDKGDWMKFAQELADRSLAAARAAEAKNPEDLLTAGGRLYETCSACHMKYIPPGEPPRP